MADIFSLAVHAVDFNRRPIPYSKFSIKRGWEGKVLEVETRVGTKFGGVRLHFASVTFVAKMLFCIFYF